MPREALKLALFNRDFEKAQALISAWGKSVTDDMKSTTGEADLRRLVDNALRFAEENTYLLHVVRAHIGSELHANSASFLYLDPEAEQHYWHLQA